MPIQPKQQPPYYNVKRSTITILNNDQIKALPTTPIQLVPTPGQGYYIKYIGYTIILNVTAGIYTNLDTSSMNLRRTGQNPVTTDIAGAYLEDDTAIWVYQDTAVNDTGEPVDISELDNLALEIFSNNSGNLTGGNALNTMRIQLQYQIIKLY